MATITHDAGIRAIAVTPLNVADVVLKSLPVREVHCLLSQSSRGASGFPAMR